MKETTIISAQNLQKKYNDLLVLDISKLEIPKHKITSIIGPSGAGKSTLLHILGTLLKPTSGIILLEAEDISSLDDIALARIRNEKLGFVFQHHNLLPEFSAIDNVVLPAMIGGRKKTDYTQKAKELLDFIGLKDRMHHKPSQLSGGEQQRVSIARALINSPKLIFADEPTGNLDSKNADDIHELFENLKTEFGYTFVIVTHNDKLSKKGDNIISLTDGKLSL